MNNKKPTRIQLDDRWTTEIYHEWDFPPEVIKFWDSVAGAYGDRGIFISYGWFENWWKSFGRDIELFTVVLRTPGEIKAIFPCSLRPDPCRGAKHRIVSSLTNSQTCYFDFVVSSDYRNYTISCFISIVSQVLPGVQLFFENMDPSGENFSQMIAQLSSTRAPFQIYSQPSAPWTDLSGDWKSFSSTLSVNFKKTLRKRFNKAESKGILNLETLRATDQLDAKLNTVFEIEYSSWKGRNGTAIKCHPDVEHYYRGLASWAMQQGNLLLFILTLNDTPIGATFCLSTGQTVFGIKVGYDESYGDISPGILLHKMMYDYFFSLGTVSKHDFLGNCEPWKMEWTNRTGEACWIRIYPKSLKGWSQYMRQYGWKNMLKKFPLIRKLELRTDEKKARNHAV